MYKFCTSKALEPCGALRCTAIAYEGAPRGIPLALMRGRKSGDFARKSGRSKKGGADTSVRLRKLRGRSTTSIANGPSIDGPFAFRSGQAAIGQHDPIFIGIQEVSGRKRDAGKAQGVTSLPGAAFPPSPGRAVNGAHPERDLADFG